MTIPDAIKKAVEGGYGDVGARGEGFIEARYSPDGFVDIDWHKCSIRAHIESIVLNPLFWQALGKAMGWHECDDCAKHRRGWRQAQLDMVAHLQDGGTLESFFNSL